MAKKGTFLENHSILRTLLYMLLITVGVIFLTYVFLRLYGRTGREYQIPDMRGMTIKEAKRACDASIRFVVTDSVYTEGDKGGHILMQDPRPGSLIKNGRKVFITISAYTPKDARMPDLTDVTCKQAVSQLSSMGFAVGRIKMVQSQFRNVVLEATCKGKVVQPGTVLPGGSVIDLTVGRDPERPYGVVPFVLGKSPERARRDIKAGTFNIGIEHFENVTNKTKAVVVRQKPAYTGVAQNMMGSTVELWYSDNSKIDVDKIVDEYKVDPNDIIDPEQLIISTMEDDYKQTSTKVVREVLTDGPSHSSSHDSDDDW